MGYRLLLDENVEHEVRQRLEAGGHDVERVEEVAALEKGATDDALAAYSLETDRTIVTYDDDFVENVQADTYRAVLFFEDDTNVSPVGRRNRRRDGPVLPLRGSLGRRESWAGVALRIDPTAPPQTTTTKPRTVE